MEHPSGWIRFFDSTLITSILKAGYRLPLTIILQSFGRVMPHPYEVTGLELSGSGPQPTPTLSVGNISNYVTALCLQYDDMVKAKVRIHTTFAKYLDAANWVHGNLTAEPDTVFVICTVPVVAQINFCQCGQRGSSIVSSLFCAPTKMKGISSQKSFPLGFGLYSASTVNTPPPFSAFDRQTRQTNRPLIRANSRNCICSLNP